MTIDDLLYKLDSVHRSDAIDRSIRDAALHAYQFIIAFKCARHIEGETSAAMLKDMAWDCQTDESSKEDAAPSELARNV